MLYDSAAIALIQVVIKEYGNDDDDEVVFAGPRVGELGQRGLRC